MEIKLDSGTYRSRPLLTEEEALGQDESFNSIDCFKSNVYIGTTEGHLLHYHRFDDSPSFIMISQQKVRSSPVKKVLVMPKLEKVIVLCGESMNLFSLPELTPLQAGKLRDVQNIVRFSDIELMIMLKTKTKIIRFIQDEIKSVRDINEPNLIDAVFLKPAKSVVVANKNSYEMIDLSNGAKTSLFQYSEDESVLPNILPFYGKDKDHNEVLLTIKSDTNTSIGMFITESGDPDRGTLTWIDNGYPNNGISIVWPYLFGVFNTTLIVSSLIDLDTKHSQDIQGKLQFLSTPASIQDDNYVLNGIAKNFMESSLIIYTPKSIELLYKVDPIEIFIEDLAKLIKGEISQIELLDISNPLYCQLEFLYYIFKEDFNKCQDLIDDLLFELVLYLYDGRNSDKFYSGTLTITQLLKPKLTDQFNQFFMNQVKSKYLKFHKLNLQPIAYSNLNSDQQVIDFINQDRDSWKIKTPNLTNIIKDLDSRGLYGAKLYSYILLQDDEQISIMCTEFLSEKYHTDYKFEYVDLILKSLTKVKDSKIYRDSLLEVLRVDSHKGIGYMKKNINGNHKSTHDGIMKEMINLADNEDFAKLKLEVLENTWREGSGNLEEIHDHLIDMLTHPNETEINNFMVLPQTYLIENTFDSHKDIISWVDYLQATKDVTECSNFIELYLKTYELSNHLGSSKLQKIIDNPLYEYFKVCFIDQDKITGLLTLGDFKAAEYIAIYDKPPYPRTPYYTKETFEQSRNIKPNLLKVLEHYKTTKNYIGLKHFVLGYGKFYNPSEIINVLPQDMSISYIQEYFIDLFINMDGTQRKLVMKKIFNRQESNLTRTLYKDFINE